MRLLLLRLLVNPLRHRGEVVKAFSLVILAGLAMNYCSVAVHGMWLVLCVAVILILTLLEMDDRLDKPENKGRN